MYVERCIYPSKKEGNEHFGMKIKQAVNENRKLFWKEVSNANRGKVESCSRIKNRNGRLALGKCEGFGIIISRIFTI